MATVFEIVKYLLKSFVLLRDLFGYLLPGSIFVALIFPIQSWSFLASSPSWLLILAALTGCYAAGNVLYALGITVSDFLHNAYIIAVPSLGHCKPLPQNDDSKEMLYYPAQWEDRHAVESDSVTSHKVRHEECFRELDSTQAAQSAKDGEAAKPSRTKKANERKWYMQGMLYASLYPDIFVEPQRHENVQIMRVGLSMGMIVAGAVQTFLSQETGGPNLPYLWMACSIVGAYFLFVVRYGKVGDAYLYDLYQGAFYASAIRLEIEAKRNSGDTNAPTTVSDRSRDSVLKSKRQ